MSRSRLQESNRRWFAVIGKVETLNLFGGGELTIEEQKATVMGLWCAQSLKEPLIFGSEKARIRDEQHIRQRFAIPSPDAANASDKLRFLKGHSDCAPAPSSPSAPPAISAASIVFAATGRFPEITSRKTHSGLRHS